MSDLAHRLRTNTYLSTDPAMAADEIERLQKDAARVRNDALDAAIKILQGYRVSVGNSSAGELAAEWTLNALRECVDEIRALKEKR